MEEMGVGGKVSSKKHLRVSECQEGVRTIFHADHSRDSQHNQHHEVCMKPLRSPFVNQEKVRNISC